MIIKITIICLTAVFALSPGSALPAEAAEVIIVGDSQFKPVVQAISEIRKTLNSTVITFVPSEVKGRFGSIVEKEGAKVVIALGDDALSETLDLPSSIPVIYGLVVTPPAISRPNTTGFYMATPVREYVNMIINYFHSIRRMAVVGRLDLFNVLGKNGVPQVASHTVKNTFEFVKTIRQLDASDAILLLPDGTLLTDTAMEEVYLESFRRGIPLLGISEKFVKHGALFALVVDPSRVGRQIGEYASKVIRGTAIGQTPPSPPLKFDLYLNLATAKKMGIQIPDEVLRRAKKAYR